MIQVGNEQKIKLEKSGALNLFVIMDNDEAGKLAREKIEEAVTLQIFADMLFKFQLPESFQ